MWVVWKNREEVGWFGKKLKFVVINVVEFDII